MSLDRSPFIVPQYPSRLSYVDRSASTPNFSPAQIQQRTSSGRYLQRILISEDQTIQIYNAGNRTDIPKVAVCHEELCNYHPDLVVRQAYNGCKLTYELFKKVFDRNSIDDQGMPIRAVVHYDKNLKNAKWDRQLQMLLFGDGDGITTQTYTSDYDIIGHELTHGIVQNICPTLPYHNQSGALNEHLGDALGIMVKQYAYHLKADQSDWLIADNTYLDIGGKRALRSMAEPGRVGLVTRPQPSHMSNYVNTTEDNGGVHINSGIPNHAFYLAATTLGGYSWEKIGKIWYQAMLQLKPDETFDSFAQKTVDAAQIFFSKDVSVLTAVFDAWQKVGIRTNSIFSIFYQPSNHPNSQEWTQDPNPLFRPMTSSSNQEPNPPNPDCVCNLV